MSAPQRSALRARALALAGRVERCPRRALDWYRHDPIMTLGGRTAAQLIRQGDGARVLAFLEAIAARERD